MRIRHNKKRNTAFVYEALIVEATVAIIKKDESKQLKTLNILKNHFKPGGVLRKDLECYRSLYEEQNLKPDISKRIINESRFQKKQLNSDALFEKQSALIKDINKNIGSSVFNNFVPNYKTLATIAQLFSDTISPKNQIILENQVMNIMSASKKDDNGVFVDNNLYNVFADKFNSKYDSSLLPEQKELLTHYISSFTDNAVSLKVFLNEEIARLKNLLIEADSIDEISNDQEMKNKTNTIIEKLNGFSKQQINEGLLLTVLKTQSLVKEIYTNGNSS
tara:strand:- start:2046 stop:2876 length:831 start_codon:yes stop_codon:yes gene_type:complete